MFGTRPRKWTRLASPSRRASCSSFGRSGPSPMIASCPRPAVRPSSRIAWSNALLRSQLPHSRIRKSVSLRPSRPRSATRSSGRRSYRLHASGLTRVRPRARGSSATISATCSCAGTSTWCATRVARRSAARVPASPIRFQNVVLRLGGRVSRPQLLSSPQKRYSTGRSGQARPAATVQNGQKPTNATRGRGSPRSRRARMCGIHHV